jgi:hypothetical protein
MSLGHNGHEKAKDGWAGISQLTDARQPLLSEVMNVSLSGNSAQSRTARATVGKLLVRFAGDRYSTDPSECAEIALFSFHRLLSP